MNAQLLNLSCLNNNFLVKHEIINSPFKKETALQSSYTIDWPEIAGSVIKQGPNSSVHSMQIEATELHNASDSPNTSLPINTSQHGLLPDQQHPAGSRDLLNQERPESAASIGSENGQSDGAEDQFSRLSVAETDDTRPKPSFQQISEYESALSPSPKKQNQGPIFRVVKANSSRVDAVNLENCPNGKIFPSKFYYSAWWNENSFSAPWGLFQRIIRNHSGNVLWSARKYDSCINWTISCLSIR